MQRGYYKFGEYCLDPEQHTLHRNGTPVQLTPKVFDTLVVLVERAGETVPTDELISAVWPDTIANKNNLDQNLHLLRKALGNSHSDEEFIKNIPKIGYRFVSDVRKTTKSANPSTHGLESGGHDFFGQRSPWFIFGSAIVLVAAFIAVAVRYLPFAATETVTITKVTASDAVSFPAISPDGNYLAYSVTRAGKASLVLKQIGTTSDAEIVPPAEVTYGGLTFSPDGKTIYYSVIEPGTGRSQLFRVAFFGGASTPIPLDALGVIGVDVSPDGSRLAFLAGNTATGESLIKLSHTVGSNESVLTVRQNPSHFDRAGARNIDWSPDGSLIAAPYRNGIDSFSRLVTVNASDGTLHEFSEHPFNRITGINWLRDMSGLMLSARGENGASGQLWFVDYPTGKATQITKDGNDYSNLALSADGKSMVALQDDLHSQLWTMDASADPLDLRSEQISLMADSAGAISDVKVDGWPGLAWTPDGRVIFASKASGNWDIWVMNSDGTDRRQLSTNERPDVRPSVSRDGKVAFISTRSGSEQVWKMNLDGYDQTQLTFGPIARLGSISPDGQWAVFTAGPSGIETLWKTSLGGGEPVQLTDKASFRPWVSPDGKFVVYDYFVNNRSRVAVIPSDGGPPVYDLHLDRTPGFEPVVKWLPGGNGLSIVRTEGGVGNIWAISLDGKQHLKLTDFKSDAIWNYGWSDDGTRLLLARGRQARDVVLMRLTPD